ncbi:hypothetical protein BB8028_0004g01630 [Beauveria bassiana]|uniref:Uncharacterized protein n=1 Tax=Beauveria bassiana TaxID=176275 RepID=A0A2S7YBK8_BEABA|nr:hypothetical protein BB8028_0004g01630 [Beauveria bassiana]
MSSEFSTSSSACAPTTSSTWAFSLRLKRSWEIVARSLRPRVALSARPSQRLSGQLAVKTWRMRRSLLRKWRAFVPSSSAPRLSPLVLLTSRRSLRFPTLSRSRYALVPSSLRPRAEFFFFFFFFLKKKMRVLVP